MKTKEEILKMTAIELCNYRKELESPIQGSDCNDCRNCRNCRNCVYCNDCRDCTDCSFCNDCRDCRDCYLCVNASELRYAICNVEVGKDAYEKKIKERGW